MFVVNLDTDELTIQEANKEWLKLILNTNNVLS